MDIPFTANLDLSEIATARRTLASLNLLLLRLDKILDSVISDLQHSVLVGSLVVLWQAVLEKVNGVFAEDSIVGGTWIGSCEGRTKD